ncbi:MAG: hypothetical protein EBV03_01740 [Proteobacteria bacterium]|nr:hypothetical protein [Pseudomonadota bacterium]
MQILILGMHRSGTSMITRLVNMMGAYFGPESAVGEITSDNPKGFWERPEVFKLNDAILGAHGCTWSDLRRWEPGNAARIPDKLAQNIKKIVLGLDANRPWVLKDPRMCLLLPGWLPHLEVPVAVVAYRHPLEVALSLYKRDRLPLEYGVALWEYYTVHMLNASMRLPRVFVRHADVMQHPTPTTALLLEQLREAGVRRLDMPSEREIHAFVDTRLHHARVESTPQPLSPAHQRLCELLQGNEAQTALLKVSEPSKALLMQGPMLAA